MKRVVTISASAILLFFGVFLLLQGGEEKGPSQEVVATSEEDVPNLLISAREAKDLLDNETALVLLDVRTKEEYTSGHISGAYLMPDTEVIDRAELELTDKSLPILVYCQSGARSARVADQLVALGYKNIMDVGGLNDWPYPEDIVTGETI